MDNASKLYKFVADRPEFFKGGHDVHTPKGLVEEILSKIELENKTVLVLFNIEFVISLVYTYGVSPENITFYSDHDNKTLMAERFGVKYCTSLDNLMKFDVVIGNPPYQDPSTPSRKIWVEMILKSFALINHNGTLCMITPNSWITRPDGQKFKKVSQLFCKYQLRYADLITPNEYFHVGEDIGFWILEPKSKYKNTIIHADWYGSIEEQEVDFRGEKIVFSNDDKIKLSIIEKILNSSKERMPFESETTSDRGIDQLISDGVISVNKTEKFSQEFFWTASQIYYTTNKISKPGIRLILNRSGYFFKEDQIDKYMPIKANVAIGIGGYGLPFNSIEEAIHARKILSSKIIRLFVEGQKTSGFNTALTKLPKFDLTMPVESLSTYFNLTQEEIDYIENAVK